MSLAIVFGGIWFARPVRRRQRASKTAVIAIGDHRGRDRRDIRYANAGPPRGGSQHTGKMFSQAVHIYGFGWGDQARSQRQRAAATDRAGPEGRQTERRRIGKKG